MKARQFASALTALAGLADPARADELRRFAKVFAGGEDSISARLKKLSPTKGYPANLKECLEEIRTGFEASGATKQATAFGTVLKTFSGRGDATVDEFIDDITAPPPPKRRAAKPPPMPDHGLARDLADELMSKILDTDAFNEVVERLRSTKQVSTPTLIVVAHRFLGNDKRYSGRKAPIDDIIRRQKADAREHARGRALSRVGV